MNKQEERTIEACRRNIANNLEVIFETLGDHEAAKIAAKGHK